MPETAPHKQGFRLAEIATALLRIAPELPAIARSLRALGRCKPDDINSIGLMLQTQARLRPDDPALRFESRQWTYGEFNRWANRIAAVFRGFGVGPGDTVAILMDNRPELLAFVAGTVKLGAVAAMINYKQRGEVLAHSLGLAGAKLLIADANSAAHADAALPFLDQIPQCYLTGPHSPATGWHDLDVLCAGAPDADPAETATVKLRDRCFYISTSGTTGLPKLAVMTHLRWVKGSIGMGQGSMRLRRDDVLYCPLPLYHNNALTVAWGAVVGAGATLALGRKFSTRRFWNEIRHHGATSFIYIGELCRYLLMAPAKDRDREHSVRVIIGNGLRPEIWDDFQQRFGIGHICEFYGAGESNLAFVNTFNLRRTAGFSPLTYAIARFDSATESPVRDANNRMQRVGKGEVGLLLSAISDKTPFDGYTDSSSTQAKVLRDVFKTGDAWFNTGDLVRSQGMRHIAFVDRVGDTFRWKGENVATTEVEGVLQACAGIAEAAVYGVAMPNADGRAGMAAVTVVEGGCFNPKSLAHQLFERLPTYAVPVFLRVLGRHDVTGTFKVKKIGLKSDGFDIREISDPVFVLVDRGRGYEPMSNALHERILDGGMRF